MKTMAPGIHKALFVVFSLLLAACHERYIDVSVSATTIVAVKEDGRLEAFGCFANYMELPQGRYNEIKSFQEWYLDGVLWNGDIRLWWMNTEDSSREYGMIGDYHELTTVGFGHCALDPVDHIQCWRWSNVDNDYLQIDTSFFLRYSFDSLVGTYEGACGVVRDGSLVCFEYNETTVMFYETDPAFPTDRRYHLIADPDWLEVSESGTVLFAISMENELYYHYYWRGGRTWVTGNLGPIADEVVSLSAEEDAVCAITGDGEMLCWSYGDAKKPVRKHDHMWDLGAGDLARVSVGWHNYCTISESGELDCPRFPDQDSDTDAIENFCPYYMSHLDYKAPPGARYHCSADDTEKQCPERLE